jgi:hypothetical protein
VDGSIVAQPVKDERAASSPSQWIQSPLWDAIWMFAGLWAPAAIALIYVGLRLTSGAPAVTGLPDLDLQTLALIYLPLSVLHRIGTTFCVLGTPILRDDIRQNPGRYLYIPLAIVVGCLVLAQCFVFHSVFSFMPAGQLWAFFVLAYVSILWERWHFCAQEFGVLSIYRARAGQSAPEDKRFDRAYTVVLMMGVNMVLFLCRGFAETRDVLLHGTPLSTYRGELLEQVAHVAFVIGMAVLAFALVREWRHPRRSLPKLLFYSLVGAHTLLLYAFPRALGLFFLNYAFHHWMVAVGLFGRVGVKAYSQQSVASGWIKLGARIGPVFVVAVILYLTLGHLQKTVPVPDARWFEGASIGAKAFLGLAVGTFFALDLLHYYYDRCFYAFSNPAVRKHVAPLIFAPPAATKS